MRSMVVDLPQPERPNNATMPGVGRLECDLECELVATLVQRNAQHFSAPSDGAMRVQSLPRAPRPARPSTNDITASRRAIASPLGD